MRFQLGEGTCCGGVLHAVRSAAAARRLRGAAAGRASLKVEGPLLGLAEALGYTGDDPGHWNFSPEWYGTQGGGWGRDAGLVVFSQDSCCGNGRVTVTAHPAVGQPSSSSPHRGISAGGDSGSGGNTREEWRVLRFNDVTRQTVMRVTVVAAPGPGSSDKSSSSSGSGSASTQPQEKQQQFQPTVTAQPDCLVQEYLKTTAAVVAALLGLQRLVPASGSGSSSKDSQEGADGQQRMLRVLCIGVGGGSLPLFLAHHFPAMEVDAVEIDPAVVAAATQAMGLPTDLPNLRLHCADAAAFLRGRRHGAGSRQGGQQERPFDLVFMDAFDGADDVPAALCTPDFAAELGAALHPGHGCFLLNLHSLEGLQPVATFKAALLGGSSHASGSSHGNGGSGSGAGSGSCFAVAAQRQRNVCVAVVRGLALPADHAAARRWLFCEAQRVAEAAGYRFPVGSRASRQLQML
ncbi:hypothetical protein ABPG75_010084 [Micractinium tetrahymenae]